MIKRELIENIVKPKLEEENLFLVDISINPSNNIIIILDGDNGVSIDSCVAISRLIESSLDRDAEDFELEVTSAGLGQPLKIFRQYIKNIGRDVEVVSKTGEKLKGTIISADNNGFLLQCTKKVSVEGSKKKQEITEQVNLEYDKVKATKVVVNFK